MSVAGAYLEIALRLGRLVPDWVDSYTGPPGLAESVAAQDAISAADLGERVQALADRVSDMLTNREKQDGIRAAARQTVVERFDLTSKCLPAYLALLRRLIRRQRQHPVSLAHGTAPAI